ncbi:hypothetical protein GALMADRAFT_141778 [Galerina marginata CBS 339.88]|uniref:G-protein coupled receptors family 1 profile domain-containing protein n=1 Tax=Galerina marginata (strain CBS 339.88) TaxID=685588 RepID=A0A067SSY2_GALM3|nr:hypothetical protein GALMADRAFT_141778 [Galerina marginata CBS 339.88]
MSPWRPSLIPGKDIHLEIAFLSSFISAVVYGLVISLYISCFRSLLKAQHLHSKIRLRFLFTYSTFLLLLSTWAMVQQTISVITATFQPESGDGTGPLDSSWLSVTEDNPWFLPVDIWAADGFMVMFIVFSDIWILIMLDRQVWRCFVLYQGISRPFHLFLVVLLIFLSVMSFLAGLLIFIPIYIVGLGPVIALSLSAFSNIIFASLIVIRLLYHQRYLHKVLGRMHGSFYTRIMVMCVESSSLIIFFTVLYIVLYFSPARQGFIFPFFLLPHICIISPLLIIYRVAHGSDAETTVSPDTDHHTGDRRTGNIRFNSNRSTDIEPGEQ